MSDPDSRLDKISASGSLLGRWGGKGSKVGKLAQFTGGVAVDGKGTCISPTAGTDEFSYSHPQAAYLRFSVEILAFPSDLSRARSPSICITACTSPPAVRL
jgi:hypothetical protein